MKNSMTTAKRKVGCISRLKGLKSIVSLTFLMVSQVLSAQPINQLNAQIAGMLASSDPIVVAEGQNLQSLTSDLHPTLFMDNGAFSYYGGENPVRVECDAASLANLYQPEAAFASVEIIVMKVDSEQDLQMIVNLDALTGFTQLKYICFLCKVELCPGLSQSYTCEEGKISTMIQGTGIAGLQIVYKVSVPN